MPWRYLGGFVTADPPEPTSTSASGVWTLTGTATDFGDLTVARYGLAGCSSAHGGL